MMHRACRLLLTISLASIVGPLSARAKDVDSALVYPSPHWDVNSLASVVRSRIHLKASELPQFPMDSSLSKEAHQWPATRAIDGVRCSLRVDTGTDAIWTVRTLREVKRGHWYCLYYVSAPWEGWKTTRRGPQYCWSSEGWLTERSWLTPDSLRNIYWVTTYYRTGEVLMFKSRSDSKREAGFDPRGPYEWFQEFFARNGDLIGCGYSKMDGSGTRVTACYWMGWEVTYDQFGKLEVELLRRAFPGPRRG